MTPRDLERAVARAVEEAESGSRVVEDLVSFLGLLRRWNRRHNLTGLRRDEDLVRVGIVDSLRAAPLLPHGEPGLDVGSGAGFPAVVLAVLERSRSWWLVEPRRKRASFLQEVVHELALSRVTVLCHRIEDLPLAARVPPLPTGLITSRAIRGIEDEIVDRLRPGGVWIRAATPHEVASMEEREGASPLAVDAVAGADLPPSAARWLRLRRRAGSR